ADDYLKLFRNLYQYADYFSVNIGCGNLRDEEQTDIREQILQILDPLFDFRRGQNHYRPVMLKISPDMTDEMIDTVTDILIDTPLDGIVATTGTLDREGLHTDAATLARIGMGNLSGAPLTQRAIAVVRRIHTRSGGTYPIIGVGGLMNADDVRAMLAAGADLVQLYTGLVYEGPKLVGDICRALAADAEKEHVAEQPEEATDPSGVSEQPASPRQETEDAAITDADIAGQTPSASAPLRFLRSFGLDS
ncbi:MAG: quinone-dependent dihydroorotate dehydrogenase, partial [Alistipes sp.]|nr:quinone-dependent dihydroorotate dehydrogenase [Alistipes sp.]